MKKFPQNKSVEREREMICGEKIGGWRRVKGEVDGDIDLLCRQCVADCGGAS